MAIPGAAVPGEEGARRPGVEPEDAWRESVMKQNVGGVDRTLRVVIGIAILAVGIAYRSWWGLIGLLPLVTGLVRVCPAYRPFGFSTRRDTPGKEAGH